MPDATVEHATCPACARPVHRYRTLRPGRGPGDVETVTTTWWLHDDDLTFACDQRPADGR